MMKETIQKKKRDKNLEKRGLCILCRRRRNQAGDHSKKKANHKKDKANSHQRRKRNHIHPIQTHEKYGDAQWMKQYFPKS